MKQKLKFCTKQEQKTITEKTYKLNKNFEQNKISTTKNQQFTKLNKKVDVKWIFKLKYENKKNKM